MDGPSTSATITPTSSPIATSWPVGVGKRAAKGVPGPAIQRTAVTTVNSMAVDSANS